MTRLIPVLSALVAFVTFLVAAPLVSGVIGRTKALLAGRRGAPIWQPYADLRKLLGRGIVYSTTTTWIFRLAPLVVMATALVAAMLVPLDGRTSLLRFAGDAVAFAYLFGLGRFLLVLAALDTGSSFEGMGASREVTFAAIVEPGVFLALVAVGLTTRSFSLTVLLGEGTRTIASPPAVMVAMGLFALALAECSRVPVDDPATHLELTMIHEVMVLDHSGPDLAMILYANALKISVFGFIIVDVLIPHAGTGLVASLAFLIGSMLGMGIAVGIIESVMARLRLPKVPLYIVSGSALALFGLVLLLS